jgi:hypothetical protein
MIMAGCQEHKNTQSLILIFNNEQFFCILRYLLFAVLPVLSLTEQIQENSDSPSLSGQRWCQFIEYARLSGGSKCLFYIHYI